MAAKRNPAAKDCGARSMDFGCCGINGRNTTARSIAQTLPGSIRNGNGYLCRCPVPSHGKGRGDRNPSLSVADGDKELVVRCFAGCDARDVLAALRARGLLDERRDPSRPRRRTPKPLPLPLDDPAPDPAAVTIWRSAEPIPGTLGEIYLRSRGITLDPPPSLRFLRAAEYLPRRQFPAIAAAVQGPDRRVIAVQLTFLDPQGWRKATVAAPRKTIGKLVRGAVRLGPAGEIIGLAEGTETALSAAQLFDMPVWACLGASRMANIWLPSETRLVTIFADRDAPGRDAAMKAANVFRVIRDVAVKFPPAGAKDWNDALSMEAAA
jgi:putative DNA primase/helicase